MATRSASIPPGAAVDITAALALENGQGYLLSLGAKSGDHVIVALGADPESVGGHFLDAGGPGRFIRQGPDTWFARHYNLQGRAAQLTVTEADDCA